MEASVWSDPRVLKLLREEFVIIALYVDDKTIKLPENEWYKPEGSKRTIKKLGKKNTDFQQRKYEVNSQPYYVILNHEEKQMVKAHSYDKNVQHFIDFLTEGLKKFKSQQIPESTFSFEN